jgi:hypothetical protein
MGVPPAIIAVGYVGDLGEKSEPIGRLASGGLLVDIPTPDFSMPFNVITLTSTLVAFFFGTMVNVLVKKSGKRKHKTERDATGPGREGILQRLRRRLGRGAKMKDE